MLDRNHFTESASLVSVVIALLVSQLACLEPQLVVADDLTLSLCWSGEFSCRLMPWRYHVVLAVLIGAVDETGAEDDRCTSASVNL